MVSAMNEKGFTLIELLTVVVLIGILAGLGIASFSVYKRTASYGVATKTLHDARTVLEASVSNYDSPPGSVPLTSQTSQGRLSDPSAYALLPQMQLPKDVKFQVEYNSACADDTCSEVLIQVDPCKGDEFVRYTRFGDGLELQEEHQTGGGCG